VQRYLLFTIIGVVITPALTTVFGLGDGIYGINGVLTPLGPFPNNAPPYLAYQLGGANWEFAGLSGCQLQVYAQQATGTIQSLLLGTDGVQDLIARETQSLPGKTELVGSLRQFWERDRYFQNPDAIRRRLTLINRDRPQPDWQQHRLNPQPGLLPDDTSLISIRRLSQIEPPAMG
jgi:hypothetical protein